MPNEPIDWEALLKAAQGSKSSSDGTSLVTSCNEGANLTGMEYFSKHENPQKDKPDDK